MSALARTGVLYGVAGLVLVWTLGCAGSSYAPALSETPADQPTLMGDEENFIRASGGVVTGRIHVVALRMDAESTSRAMRELGRWAELTAPHAGIEVVVDRALAPGSLTTSAPLLVMPSEPTSQYTGGDFWQRLERYMANGGTVLFAHGEIPKELRTQTILPIGKSHPLMTTPFEVNPGGTFQGTYVAVGGQAAALDVKSLTALSPLLRVNIIAHAIRRHPGGVYELTESKPAGDALVPPRMP